MQNNNEYSSLVHWRKEEVDGVSPWLWIKEDNGAWDGPSKDWPEFKALHKKYCKKRRIVVQAGGALGMYPRLLSEYFEYVYSFEPDSLNFHCAVNNCQRPNIRLFNAALGSYPHLTSLKLHDRKNSGMHSIDPTTVGYVPTFTIDDLALTECDLIMLDVEGYEYDVLNGASATIDAFRPMIQTELARGPLSEFMRQKRYVEVGRYHQDIFWMPET